MTDKLLALLAEHFVFLVSVVLGIIAVVLLLALKLFHELRTDPSTRKALKEEGRFIRGLVSLFKKDVLPKPGEPDPFAETALPFKAVKDPRAKVEDEEGG